MSCPTYSETESGDRLPASCRKLIDGVYRRTVEKFSTWKGETGSVDCFAARFGLLCDFLGNITCCLIWELDDELYGAALSMAKSLAAEAAEVESMRSGFKVPTTYDHPATAGQMNERGIHPAVAVNSRDVGVQAECRVKRRDAAVGGAPVVRVDKSVQTLYASRDPPAILEMRGSQAEGRGPASASEGDFPARLADGGLLASRDSRGSPSSSERRRRRRRKQCAAKSAVSAPSNSSANVKGTGSGDMTPTGTPVSEGHTEEEAGGTGFGPPPPSDMRPILCRGRVVGRSASSATSCGDRRRRLSARYGREEGSGGGCDAEWPVQPSAAPQAGAQKEERAAAATEGGRGLGV